MNKTLVFVEEETWQIAFRCRRADLSPMDLTGADVRLRIGEPGEPVTEFGNPMLTDPAKGEGHFTILPEHQGTLPPANYQYELRVFLPDTRVSSQARGLLCIEPSRFDEIPATVFPPGGELPGDIIAALNEKADKAANLSDLTSIPTARINLGLGDAATKNVGTIAGTVAAGDDPRLVTGGNAVTLTGNQTVNGIKTFVSSPVVPTATTATQAVNKSQLDLKADDSAVVKLTGNQTVAGIKTFSSPPVLPLASIPTTYLADPAIVADATYSCNVYKFPGATFTDKFEAGLQYCATNSLTLYIPSGTHTLTRIVTFNGTGGHYRVSIRGDGPLSSRINCTHTDENVGGRLKINLTSYGQFELQDLWFCPVGHQDAEAPGGNPLIRMNQDPAVWVYWNGMSSSRGFRIQDVHFGTNSSLEADVNSWLNCLRLNGKGTALIQRVHVIGRRAPSGVTAPTTNGIQIDNCKEVEISNCSLYHTNYGLYSADNDLSISEGIKISNCTLVNTNYGVYHRVSQNFPNFELTNCHIAYNKRGVFLRGWTQSIIAENLIYPEADSTQLLSEDVYLEDCPSMRMHDNQFFSGKPKGDAGVDKIGLTLKGSSRNSYYKNNLFSERDVGIRLLLPDAGPPVEPGIDDVIIENNYSEKDLAGASTVTRMYEVEQTLDHNRILWRGETNEFTAFGARSTTLTLTSGAAAATLSYGTLTCQHQDFVPTNNLGEYTVYKSGVSRARIKAGLHHTSAAAGTVTMTLWRLIPAGAWTELTRVTAYGPDVTMVLESGEFAFAGDYQFRIQVQQNSGGNGTVAIGAWLEFHPTR